MPWKMGGLNSSRPLSGQMAAVQELGGDHRNRLISAAMISDRVPIGEDRSKIPSRGSCSGFSVRDLEGRTK
jgi:hypothetical protein